MRIAAIFNSDSPNAQYRAVLPLRELERRGHTVLWPPRAASHATMATIPKCDAMLLHRCIAPVHVELLARLRERNIAIVWDNDDDILTVPKSVRKQGGWKRRHLRDTFNRSIQLAKAATLMTTPSRHLADMYRSAGVSHVQVIENAVATGAAGTARRPHRGLVIGCAAAAEHDTDFARLQIRQVLERLLRKHEHVRVVSIGHDLAIDSPAYHAVGYVPFGDLIDREREFDIGLAPLDDTPFNRARSNIKLKEYAAAGAMWLASPVGPYRDLGEEQGGMLVKAGDWHDVLDSLVVEDARRVALTANARAWGVAQTIKYTVASWERALRAAVNEAHSN